MAVLTAPKGEGTADAPQSIRESQRLVPFGFTMNVLMSSYARSALRACLVIVSRCRKGRTSQGRAKKKTIKTEQIAKLRGVVPRWEIVYMNM